MRTPYSSICLGNKNKNKNKNENKNKNNNNNTNKNKNNHNNKNNNNHKNTNKNSNSRVRSPSAALRATRSTAQTTTRYMLASWPAAGSRTPFMPLRMRTRQRMQMCGQR